VPLIISLYQDKECLEMQYRVAEKEMNDLRDKLVNANRSLTSATGNISNQEALICQLRGKPPIDSTLRTTNNRLVACLLAEDLKAREEKTQRVQNELRHLLESVAILVSTPNRFVESHENAIKDRIREILADSKDQSLVVYLAIIPSPSRRRSHAILHFYKNFKIRIIFFAQMRYVFFFIYVSRNLEKHLKQFAYFWLWRVKDDVN